MDRLIYLTDALLEKSTCSKINITFHAKWIAVNETWRTVRKVSLQLRQQAIITLSQINHERFDIYLLMFSMQRLK